MTPSLSGRIAEIVPGVRPSIRFASTPDRVHLAGPLVDRDHGRLREHDAAPPDVDEGVRGAEVDGHVSAAEAGKGLEPGHEERRECTYAVCSRFGA